MHHEPFYPNARDWKFETTGPLSGANGALAWIVFVRDIKQFKKLFPQLRLVQYHPHTPLQYWMSGGLKTWNLIPRWAITLVTTVDQMLIRVSPQFGSFVDIEVVREMDKVN